MRQGVAMAVALCSMLAACGGGGSDSGTTTTAATGGAATGSTNGGTTGTGSTGSGTGGTATGSGTTGSGNTGSGTSTGGTTTGTGSTGGGTSGGGTGEPGSTPPSPPAVIISSVSAPPEGSRLAGTYTLVVEGQNIANAELLMANGYAPQLGRFTPAADGRSATLSFNSNIVPNGPLTLRISAWNMPAGSSGAGETIAMPARTWTFANTPPPAGTDAGRTARCMQMGYPATPLDPADPVVCVMATRTSTPIEQCTSFGTGYGSPEDLLEVLRNGARISKLYCQPGANNGVLNPGCSCLS